MSESDDSRSFRGARRPADGSERFLRCWSCGRQLTPAAVRADGVIQARRDRYGGPYYLYACSACGQENMCETTAGGTLFASPPFSPTALDWLLGKLSPGGAEEFLRIAAWHRREHERRRYVFERDGDFRYSSPWERLKWYFRREEEVRGPAIEEEGEARGLPSPYEILGVPPGASVRDVKRAFLRLARKYHPDKSHHLGPEVARRASERFKELLAAYEKLVGSG